MASSAYEAIMLGSAQDGGVPQAGCYCTACNAARRDPALRRMVTCLGLIDHRRQQCWMIDATPDFPRQLDLLHELSNGYLLRGIILTHAHIGHYSGLIQLGREVIGARMMPVYTSAQLGSFLGENGPWAQLIALGNIELRSIEAAVTFELAPDLHITPIAVPHRAEYSDTMAFLIGGPQRQLFYCPDIDSWEDWEHDLPTFLATIDLALLDGSFYSAAELPGRDMREIPHPLVGDTIARLAPAGKTVGFTHLNHSNPLLRNGPELQALQAQGHWVVHEGMRWSL